MPTQRTMECAVSQQSELHRDLMTAIHAHFANLRYDINHIERIIGCIAKSSDEKVVEYLPEGNQSISSLREVLSTLQIHCEIFETKQAMLDGG